jgi:hypothetical protein
VAETTQSLMGESQSRYGLESGLELTQMDSTDNVNVNVNMKDQNTLINKQELENQ